MDRTVVTIAFRQGIWSSARAEERLRGAGKNIYGAPRWQWIKGRAWLRFRVAAYELTGSGLKTVELREFGVKMTYLLA